MLLYNNIANGSPSETLGGSPFQFPKLVQGRTLRLSLRPYERINGEAAEVKRVVRSLSAGLGWKDTRPEDGQISFKLGNGSGIEGEDVTAPLTFNFTADQIEKAFNRLSAEALEEYLPCSIRAMDGSFYITFKNGGQLDITAFRNELWPVSFARVMAVNKTIGWEHEIRLVQSPVAFSSVHSRVVAPPPTITRIQAGNDDGFQQWNEIQKLILPANFRGTFQLRRGLKRSVVLNEEDDESSIADGIESLADEGGEFVVTLPADDTVYIEFTGSMAATAQDLLQVQIIEAPEGDLTINLKLDRPELATLLRRGDAQKVPLEVVALVEDENDPEVLYPLTFLKTEVTVERQLIWPGLSSTWNNDWMRPPQPESYIPFTPDQIAAGVLHYPFILGDDEATVFPLDHNLHTELVLVWLRMNETPGQVLRLGTDFIYTVENDNSVEITMLGDLADPAPATGSIAGVVFGLGQASLFDPHGHTIPQVHLLQDALDELAARIQELEIKVPSGVLALDTVSSNMPSFAVDMPRVFELYPTRENVTAKEDIAAVDVSNLGKGGLLPAVHDAEVSVLPLPLPEEPDESFTQNVVYQNQSGEPIELPGDSGRRTVLLLDDEYAACVVNENRLSWYKVAKIDDAKTTFYPLDFQRTLFEVSINEKQFRLKKLLQMLFGFEVAVLKSNTRAQWILRIEHGTYLEKSEPATTDKNLDKVEWNTAEPLLEQVIHVTSTPTTHWFGCKLARALVAGVDTITATANYYGAEEGTANKPATANFALRVVMVGFDTEDSQLDPLGFIAINGLTKAVTASDSESGSDANLGKVMIITP